jgi:hypothetical protein
MTEKRKIQRLRVLKTGRIVLNQGGIIDCIVRNMTPRGACLEVINPLGIADEFTLVNSDQVKRPCSVVWRYQKRIGVAFKLSLSMLACFNPLMAGFEFGELAVLLAA